MRNKLLRSLLGVTLGLSLAVGVSVGVVSKKQAVELKADEEVAYNLTPANTTSNSYAGSGTVTIAGVEWTVEGNGQIDPWRLGGKSSNCNSATRRVYSNGAVSSQNISRVELYTGTATSITVNSLHLIVSGTAGGGSNVESDVQKTFAASSTIVFDRPENADWSSKYFTFSFNLTTTESSNKFVQFIGAKFYYEAGQNVNHYDVTFYPLNGEDPEVRNVVEGATINPLPTPTKAKDSVNQKRYEFAGWYTVDDPNNIVFEEENIFNTSTQVTADTALYAKYNEINYYIVSFNTNGGDEISSQEVDEGAKVVLQNSPTKSGFLFAGWYTNLGLTDAFDIKTDTVSEDITLYAKWNSIAIEEDGFFERITSAEDLVNGGKYLITYNDSVAFNGNLNTLDASSNTVPISVENNRIEKNNNTSSAYFTIDTEHGYIKSASGFYIGRTGSTNGLNTASTPTTNYENSISFDANGNVVITVNNVYLRYNPSSGQERFRYFTQNQQMIQLFKFVRSYTVSFNSLGGSNVDSATVAENGTINPLPAPTKAKDSVNQKRYEFAGWYTNVNFEEVNRFTTSTQVTSNMTLFAKYSEISYYIVSFDTNGGTIIPNQEVDSGNTVIMPSNPEKEPDASYTYTFEGWYTNPGLSDQFNSSTPVVNNFTLYANYTTEAIDNPNVYLVSATSIATIHGTESINTQDQVNSVIFEDLGLAGDTAISGVSIGAVTLNGAQGAHASLPPRYNSTDKSMRVYKGNTFTFTSATSITRIEFTFTEDKYSQGLVASSGSLSDNVWTGEATSITFTNPSDNAEQVRFTEVEVTYDKEVLSVTNVALRFGLTMPKSQWDQLASKWTLSDYGVMLFQTTEDDLDDVSSVETYFRADPANVKICHKGSGEAPYLDGDDYLFTVKIKNIVESSYDAVICAAPFIVLDGEYYFLEEKQCSVRSLASTYLSNGGSDLSDAALDILAGN